MDIVEANRYSRFLDDVIDKVLRTLDDDEYIMKTVIERKYNGNINTIQEKEYHGLFEDAERCELIDFLLYLLKEKEDIMYAIGNAKPRHTDIENELDRTRILIAAKLMELGKERESAVKEWTETHTRTDEFGKLVVTECTVLQTSTPMYSREEVRNLARQIYQNTGMYTENNRSTEVNFHPSFDRFGNEEDAYTRFVRERIAAELAPVDKMPEEE